VVIRERLEVDAEGIGSGSRNARRALGTAERAFKLADREADNRCATSLPLLPARPSRVAGRSVLTNL